MSSENRLRSFIVIQSREGTFSPKSCLKSDLANVRNSVWMIMSRYFTPTSGTDSGISIASGAPTSAGPTDAGPAFLAL